MGIVSVAGYSIPDGASHRKWPQERGGQQGGLFYRIFLDFEPIAVNSNFACSDL